MDTPGPKTSTACCICKSWGPVETPQPGQQCALNSAEIATLLANSIRYDIAEAVDPEFHIVAKLRKDALTQVPKPANASMVFCGPDWGCVRSD